MASGLQQSKDEFRPKAPSKTTTKTTSSTAGAKPKHRGAGCSSASKPALMFREMEDLRNLAIGSPVPTPRTDDDVEIFADGFDDESFPAIKIDRCVTAVDARLDDGSSARPDDPARNGRPRDETAATKGGVAPRSSTSNHAKTDQRCD